jgi:hypothetical protein
MVGVEAECRSFFALVERSSFEESVLWPIIMIIKNTLINYPVVRVDKNRDPGDSGRTWMVAGTRHGQRQRRTAMLVVSGAGLAGISRLNGQPAIDTKRSANTATPTRAEHTQLTDLAGQLQT